MLLKSISLTGSCTYPINKLIFCDNHLETIFCELNYFCRPSKQALRIVQNENIKKGMIQREDYLSFILLVIK